MGGGDSSTDGLLTSDEASGTVTDPKDAEPELIAAAEPPARGEPIGIIQIPRLGVEQVVVQGSGPAELRAGPGHLRGTAMPGEVGNFSMAGHRTTYGKPFNRIAELRAGDVIVIETRDTYFVYQVTEHLIVAPSHGAVLLPVPEQPGATPTQAALTMTSCHPEYSARQRYIVHGLLQASYPRASGLPADVLEVQG